ncbi:hypothetical protein NPIL_554821 [Nephila pilipes]|uniref:Uncharacterized protein n=1 Tax=Nephila pilipes TaxID=299642 RepID=A0A8X6MYU5_NEPPI|nr:hypothetical protein NPIL_554821 [Nephila pilipes]
MGSVEYGSGEATDSPKNGSNIGDWAKGDMGRGEETEFGDKGPREWSSSPSNLMVSCPTLAKKGTQKKMGECAE